MALSCTHTGSYLTLPAVDLETLEAEFQDDDPTSGTVLGGRELVGAAITPQALPCPTQPQYQSLGAGQPSAP